jgi:hypothetical protein
MTARERTPLMTISNYSCLHLHKPILTVGDTVTSPLGFMVVTLLDSGLGLSFMGGPTQIFLAAYGATSCKLASTGIAFTCTGPSQSQGLTGVFGMDAQDDACVNFYAQNGTVLQTYSPTASLDTLLSEIEEHMVRVEDDLRGLHSSLESLKLRIARRLSEEGGFASHEQTTAPSRRIQGHVAPKERPGETGTGI